MQVLIFFIFIIPTLISIISTIKVKINGSDEVYHILMIDAIRQNNHLFINSMPFFVGKNVHAYPQLLHWIFSFVSKDKVLRNSKYLSAAFNGLTAIGIYFFSKYLFLELKFEDESLEYKIFMVSVGLLYSLSPILYDLVNSKNLGFSARGLGLFLGYLFLFLFLFFLITNSIVYYFLSIFIVVLIILSSVFAFQFVIFFTFFYSIFTWNINPILIPIFSLLILFIILPQIIENYLIGQYNHKLIYFNYLARIFILKKRFSIWRDFVFDFWVKVLSVFNGEIKLFAFGKYFITNPIINLVLGIPALFLVQFNIRESKIDNILILFILSSICIFIATSFRKTRFLGEPERYVEFIIPIIAIKIALNSEISLNGLIIFYLICSLLIFAKIFIIGKYIKSNEYKENSNFIVQLKENVLNFSCTKKDRIKILCQNTQLSKLLFSSDYQIFRHPLFQSHIGKFSFLDVHYDNYDNIYIKTIPDLIRFFKIDFVILNSESDFIIFKNSGIKYSDLKKINNLILFSIEK
jgi:hypothetical protein